MKTPIKKALPKGLERMSNVITSLPEDFVVSGDHMKPEAYQINEIGTNGIEGLLERLNSVKKAELIIGRHLSRDEATMLTEKEFFDFAEETIDILFPIYDIIIGR